MAIIATCTKCGKKYGFPELLAGKPVRCPHCQSPQVAPVPLAPSPVASPASTPPTVPSSQERRARFAWTFCRQHTLAGAALSVILVVALIAWSLTRTSTVRIGEAAEQLAKNPRQEPQPQEVPQPRPQEGPPVPAAPQPNKATVKPAARNDAEQEKAKVEQPPPIPEKEGLPPIVVHIRSLDALTSALRTMAESAGQAQVLDVLLGSVKAQFGPGGLPGIDSRKPLGLYVQRGSGSGLPPVIALIPVDSQEALLNVLRMFGAHPDNEQVYVLANPGLPRKIMFRFAHGYAWITTGSIDDLGDDKLVKPADLFPDSAELASISVRFDRLLREAREPAITQLRTQSDWLLQMLALASKGAQKDYNVKVLELFMRAATDVIAGGKELAFHLDVDAPGKELRMEVSLSGTPGSALATNFASVGQEPSQFARLLKSDAAMNALVHFKLPDGLGPALAGLAQEATKAVLKDAKDGKDTVDKDRRDRADAERLFRLLERNFAAGEVDVGLLLTRRDKTGPLTLAGGMKVVDGLAFEKWLKDMAATLTPEEEALFQFDLERSVNGRTVKIHRHNPHGFFAQWIAPALGKNPSYYIFRNDRCIWAGGADGEQALLDAFTLTPARAPVFHLELNVKHLAGLFNPTEKRLSEGIFNERNPGRVQITLDGGASLRLQARMDLMILRLVSFLIAR